MWLQDTAEDALPATVRFRPLSSSKAPLFWLHTDTVVTLVLASLFEGSILAQQVCRVAMFPNGAVSLLPLHPGPHHNPTTIRLG